MRAGAAKVATTPDPSDLANPTDGSTAAQAVAEAGSATAAERMEAYQKVIGRLGDYVTMLGHMIGSTAVRVMREDMQPTNTAAIWAGQETFTVPDGFVGMLIILHAKMFSQAMKMVPMWTSPSACCALGTSIW